MKLLLVAILIACSQAENVKIDPLLTGGAVAIGGEFPSAVFIRAPGTPNQLCGGTIIDREHVSVLKILKFQQTILNFSFQRFSRAPNASSIHKTSLSTLSGSPSPQEI
jgi:hypothetical protein